MASVQSHQNGDCVSHMPVEQLLPPDFSGAYDDFGDPEISPRTGEYQVQIPLLDEKSDYTTYGMKIDAANAHSPDDFFVGLPIPLMWIDRVKPDSLEVLSRPKIGSDIKPSESNNIKKTEFNFDDETLGIGIGPSYISVDNGGPIRESENLPSEGKLCKCIGQEYLSIPGLFSEHWSDIEKASFLLGLYIFEKNFVQVRHFIQSKKMGDVLTFYYGDFYGSLEYRRWSDCRKMRNKRCVYGRNLFSGVRQQELLSRVLPKVSEECGNALLEVSKTFGEGKIPLEDYVSSMKAMVGMNILVEAVGIGKGKQDLTGMALEKSRSNQVVPMRSEIPTGKAWSSLTTSEIVEFLTGDYRLSKARSNDLFWEAVWPRLLARGWHSELPKNQRFAAGSKQVLVFLMPGVTKFSRKLVKGDRYFDSVSDVLSKVAIEPGLLELKVEEDDGNKHEEDYKWTAEENSEKVDHDQSTTQQHYYLQPRTPCRNTDILKFTVVDTSLSDGKPYSMRELRSLPFEISNTLTSKNHSEDGDEETSDDHDTVSTMVVDINEMGDGLRTTKFDGETFPGRKNHDVNASYQETRTICPDISSTSMSNLKNKMDLHKDKLRRNFEKSQSRQKLKKDTVDNITPIFKQQRRLTSCSHETGSVSVHSSMTHRLDDEMSSYYSSIHKILKNISSEGEFPRDKLSSTSSPKGSSNENIEYTPNGNIHATEPALENAQTRALIDLNLPHVSPDFEKGVVTSELNKEQGNHCSLKSSAIEASSAQLPSMQRHSTRNRPPTTKALEALANGFLTVNRRRKSKDANLQENSTSRRYQRARGAHGVVVPIELRHTTGASQSEEAEIGVSNSGHSNLFSKHQVLAEENEKPVSGLQVGKKSSLFQL